MLPTGSENIIKRGLGFSLKAKSNSIDCYDGIQIRKKEEILGIEFLKTYLQVTFKQFDSSFQDSFPFLQIQIFFADSFQLFFETFE